MAQRKIDWEKQVGRRINLRDLHVFFTVVQCASMAKAATELGVSQPTVSAIIAGIEHTYRVRLFDRSSRGVEPTIYGKALLKRSIVVFDELKQSSRDIAYLADPTVGELRIGYQESVSPAVIVPAIRRFSAQYPSVVLHADNLPSAGLQLAELRARKYDCTLQLLTRTLSGEADLNVEVLFNDRLALAANIRSRWGDRRKINLAELVDEPWILTPPGTWARVRLEEAFRRQKLPMPKTSIVTMSVPLRAQLVANSNYISNFPRSLLRVAATHFGLKQLPVAIYDNPWPLVLVTLKNRTLTPVVESFIACLREVAASPTLFEA